MRPMVSAPGENGSRLTVTSLTEALSKQSEEPVVSPIFLLTIKADAYIISIYLYSGQEEIP